jgi:hypothetical protein
MVALKSLLKNITLTGYAVGGDSTSDKGTITRRGLMLYQTNFDFFAKNNH